MKFCIESLCKSLYKCANNNFVQELRKNSIVPVIGFFWLLLCTIPMEACPTCIGNLDIDTPPLFSKEYEKQYALYDDGTLDIAHTQESNHEIH